MEENNIEILLNIFTNTSKEDKFVEDNQKIMYMCELLKEMQKQLPTPEKLEKAKEIVTDLEIKYEDFFEIANYFDPLYIKIKDIIHKKEVEKIREENRKKRVIK